MKLKILLLKNRDFTFSGDDFVKYSNWLKSLGFEPEIDEKFISLDLEWEQSIWNKTYWFLKDLHLKLFGKIEPFKWHIVVFLYDFKKAGFPETKDKRAVNKTEWVDFLGSALIQMTAQEWYDKKDWVFKILRHETIHAFNRLLEWRGIYFPDRLDTEYTQENENRHLAMYKPYFPKMVQEYPLWQKIKIMRFAIQWVKDVIAKKKKDWILKLIEETALKYGINKESKVFKEGLATLKAESGLNPEARFVNKDGSIDRGIAQWNSKYWPQITDEMAYDPKIALDWFWRYFLKNPNLWVAYKTGKYKEYL